MEAHLDVFGDVPHAAGAPGAPTDADGARTGVAHRVHHLAGQIERLAGVQHAAPSLFIKVVVVVVVLVVVLVVVVVVLVVLVVVVMVAVIAGRRRKTKQKRRSCTDRSRLPTAQSRHYEARGAAFVVLPIRGQVPHLLGTAAFDALS